MEIKLYGPVGDLSTKTRTILGDSGICLEDKYYYIILRCTGPMFFCVGNKIQHPIYKIGDPYKYRIIAIICNESLYQALNINKETQTFMIIGDPTKFGTPADIDQKIELPTEDE